MRSTAIANQLSLFCFVRDKVKRRECVTDAGLVPLQGPWLELKYEQERPEKSLGCKYFGPIAVP